ncbi:flagellar biosynthesis protein FlgN [Thermotoga maritima MSB8]|jgi:hypothetical protein|uniref:flagellar protein FlgN n=1 Tax=Thermotoga TaxID=2335 RepID=UPI00022D9B60|nr:MULTISPECIES: flagellar protein FlgN [Thermotoga]AGL49007.1 FlgN Protein [Thermotoga maritima MSB8]AHD18147.1 FlgN family protein [Thermotoga maritima MSB8]AKE26030.1 flagellar biosynthesis protein FlgN [Thermotoga maritima]AKE27892.1 flagellar biosynthesis protein FlgN [Thermotoga maritima MSB8]AKE29765.1 flagellar biosynthesis protein FlgN [Thermotoga maritima]
MREELKRVLTEKIRLMENMRNLLEEELEAIINKDFERLESILPRIEELSVSMETCNERLKSSLESHGNGTKLIDLLEIYKDDEEMLSELRSFFETLNKLVFEIEKLKQAIGFHLNYIDFVFNLQRNELTYNRNGSFDRDGPSMFNGRS